MTLGAFSGGFLAFVDELERAEDAALRAEATAGARAAALAVDGMTTGRLAQTSGSPGGPPSWAARPAPEPGLGARPTLNGALTGGVDGIVVLTGGDRRIAAGVDALAAGVGRRLLVSGVGERTSREDLANRAPGRRDLFGCCVDLDRQAMNTIGNAAEARGWAQAHGYRTLLVVTAAYHMPRSLAELRHAMPEVRLVPYAVRPYGVEIAGWWRDTASARLLAGEYAKYLAARARIAGERVLGWRTGAGACPAGSGGSLLAGGSPFAPPGPPRAAPPAPLRDG